MIAYRTFQDQYFVHIWILTMFIEIFRVNGGGRFKATVLSVFWLSFSVSTYKRTQAKLTKREWLDHRSTWTNKNRHSKSACDYCWRVKCVFTAFECFKMHCNVSQWFVTHFNLSHECVQLRQMMKNDQHSRNVTIFLFCVTIEMIAKGQRGTRSHSNMSFLQCAANGLVSFVAVRSELLRCVARDRKCTRKFHYTK